MGTVVLDVGSKDYRSVCEVTKCCECATPDNWKNMGGGHSGGGHSGGGHSGGGHSGGRHSGGDHSGGCHSGGCHSGGCHSGGGHSGGCHSGGGHSGGAKCKGTGSCIQELQRGTNSQMYFENFCWGEIKIL